MKDKTTKQLILDEVNDRCADLLYYNRKEDEDLTSALLISALLSGEVTVSDMVNEFTKCVNEFKQANQ